MTQSLLFDTHLPDILNCLANLSNDEVFTPPDVANQMLDMLPEELFKSPDTKFLDPACKTGVFLREIAKRLLKNRIPQYDEKLKKINKKKKQNMPLTDEDEMFLEDLQRAVDHIFQNQLYGIAITQLTSLLSPYFLIGKCAMGEDPREALRQQEQQERQAPVPTQEWLSMHYLERYGDAGILVGYYKNKEHLQWIMGRNKKGTLVYNVRLAENGGDQRHGAHTANYYDKQKVRFAVLYTGDYEQTGDYKVFLVKDTAKKVGPEVMEREWYPKDDPNGKITGSYYFYRFFEEVSLGEIDIAGMIDFAKRKMRNEPGPRTEYEPLFLTCREALDNNLRTSLNPHKNQVIAENIQAPLNPN